MNIHNEINQLRATYATPEASEALQAGLSLAQEYIKSLESSLKVSVSKADAKRNTKLAALNSYAGSLLNIFESILSNKSVTKNELLEAKEIFRNKLDELESIVTAL